MCGRIALQFVCNQSPWRHALTFQQFAEKPFGSFFIPTFLNQNIDRVAIPEALASLMGQAFLGRVISPFLCLKNENPTPRGYPVSIDECVSPWGAPLGSRLMVADNEMFGGGFDYFPVAAEAVGNQESVTSLEILCFACFGNQPAMPR